MPYTSIHDPMPMESETITWYVTRCSCGWKSKPCWSPDDSVAEFEEHEHAAAVIIPLFR